MAGLTFAAAPVEAFDLNGTWTGKISCKGVFNGAAQTLSSAPTLLVDDGGTTLELAVDGVHYSAASYPTTGHPEKGEIALIRCDTNSTRSGGDFGGEFGRMKITTKASTGSGSISGTSFRASILIAPSLATCKWSFKRVNPTRVGLDGCTSPPPV
jgi:hypothetical protein